MDKLNGTTLLILLGGAGVGIYLLTRPTPKATGPIDAVLGIGGKVLGAAGEIGGDLAEGVSRIAMPLVKPVAGFVESATKLPTVLGRTPGMAYEAGSAAVGGVVTVGRTVVGGISSGITGLSSTIGGLF